MSTPEIDRTSHSYLLGQTEAKLKVAQDDNKLLRDLVQTLLDNDPEDMIADNGMRVMDGWRERARRILAK